MEQRLLPYNPVAGVRLERKDNTKKSKIRTEAEIQKLLALADPTMQALILAMVDCGFRCMEVFTLQWGQISLIRHRGEQRPMVDLSGRRRMVPAADAA